MQRSAKVDLVEFAVIEPQVNGPVQRMCTNNRIPELQFLNRMLNLVGLHPFNKLF